MTYRCGLHGFIGIGRKDEDARIVCDGCGLVRGITAPGSKVYPAQWFLKDKAPPGWKRINDGTTIDPKHRHYCKECKR